MAKPLSFGRPSKPKGGSTSFNFGANVRKPKGGSARRGGGGGKGGGS